MTPQPTLAERLRELACNATYRDAPVLREAAAALEQNSAAQEADKESGRASVSDVHIEEFRKECSAQPNYNTQEAAEYAKQMGLPTEFAEPTFMPRFPRKKVLSAEPTERVSEDDHYYYIPRGNGGIYLQRKTIRNTSDNPLSAFEEMLIALCRELLSLRSAQAEAKPSEHFVCRAPSELTAFLAGAHAHWLHYGSKDDSQHCAECGRYLPELTITAAPPAQPDSPPNAAVWGPEKQDYPGGPIYRVGTSTGVTLPPQPDSVAAKGKK